MQALDLESKLKALDANLSFVSELLQSDIRLFCRNEIGEVVLYNFYHPNQDSLFLDCKLSLRPGTKLELHKDIPVHKAFDMARPVVGQYGLVMNNRPVQEYAYPIKCGDVVIAVVAIERDIYLTRTILGQHWDLIADTLIKSIAKKINSESALDSKYPKIAITEGVIILEGETVFFADPLAISLLSDLVEFGSELVGRKFNDLLNGFGRKYKGKYPERSIESIEEIKLNRKTINIQKVIINDEAMSVLLIKDVSELKMKETLLREIHHRVKNNLATVASLLRMQKRRNPDLQAAFNEAITRVNSISLVHESLAYADDIELVDFGQLSGEIIKEICTSYGAQDLKLNFHCPEKIFIHSEKATNLSLVLNELLNNCFEHANPTEVNISLYLDHDIKDGPALRITVEDDGKGFPEGFDYRQDGGLGWEIIGNLAVESFGAELTIEKSDISKSSDKPGAKISVLVRDLG